MSWRTVPNVLAEITPGIICPDCAIAPDLEGCAKSMALNLPTKIAFYRSNELYLLLILQ
jgi:hypothetical protein